MCHPHKMKSLSFLLNCQKQNLLKTKHIRGVSGKKKQASAFCNQGPISDVEIFLQKLLPTPKNYVQPEVEEKNFTSQKIS